MTRRLLCAFLTGALALAGCGRDEPTGVGGQLIPGGALRSFEFELDALQFLSSDTTFSGYIRTSAAGFQLVAHDFAGLDAHTLLHFVMPTAVSVRDSAGNLQTDTLPALADGTLVVHFDTAASRVPDATVLAVYPMTEHWDRTTATWTLRVDSLDRSVPWTTPGGTHGPLLDTASVLASAPDSAVFAIDSATVQTLADTTNHAIGLLLAALTPDVRLRATSYSLTVNAHPSLRTDTVVTATAVTTATFIYTPPPPASGDLRVGGVPTWRSFLELQRSIRSLVLPCPDATPGCTVSLKDATINYAALLLQPVVTPDAYRPTQKMQLYARPAETSPLIPLSRSPLGSVVGVVLDTIAPSRFQEGTTGGRVEMPITPFITSLVADTTATGSTTAPPNVLALLPPIEGGNFGFASFASLASGAKAPMLRLVVTVATEVQLP